MLALSAALAAACFVKAFGVTFLGRPRKPAAANAKETDGWSLTAMFILTILCVLSGILPGYVIDGLAPVTQSLVGGHMPAQSEIPWLSIVPIQESRSSYNGLLVFIFIAFSATAAAYVIHRIASDAVRRGPAWDCGFPELIPQTQYTASSFAQPIRRVFGTIVFRASEHVDMPPPGDMRAAHMTVRLRDLVWETFYSPVAKYVELVAARLNYLQFWSIRRYISLVFAALVSLLLVLAIWP
jgi:hydrogenase-4 component B